jgi:hypothetical protein
MTETAITANADKNVTGKEMIFRFKKDKLGNKRANVKCDNVPVPSVDGLITIFEKGGKELELLLEVASDTVRSVLADIVGSTPDFDPEKFDFSAVSWEKIANMPKEDRRSSSIATEVWEGFVADYIAVMPGLTKKPVEAVTLATEIYVKKMTPVRSNKNALKKLEGQLALYAETANAENFSEILELLTRRITNYLSVDDPVILAENL